MKTKILTVSLTHLLINTLVIGLIVWLLQKFEEDNYLYHFALITGLTIFNLVFMLTRFKRTQDYHQSFLSSLIIGFVFLCLMMIQLKYARIIFEGITKQWTTQLQTYFEMTLFFLLLSSPVALFFRSKNKKKKERDDVLD
ncbi:MAG: hypothetical protein HYZ14_16135 [Bacteroidetes bacterium]|nr:hypothetical protein [Bacteroidota bacterium]